MKLARHLKFLSALVMAMCLVVQSTYAAFDPIGEDIDIFLANPSITAERPNVLILLDNTANWNTPFSVEKAALVSVVNSLNDGYNVGLMMFPETGSPNDNVDGGYVRFAVRQMTTANKAALASMVNALDVLGDKGNNATTSLLMYEAYAYFAGITARAGAGKVKRDYAGNTVYNPLAASLAGNAFTSAASTTYVSPIANGCQKNFIIYISNGPVNENNSALATAQSLLAGLVGKNPPDTITISPNGQQGNWMDEYAKFMSTGDCNATFAGTQSITTYTVEVDPGTTGQAPATTALMQSAAINGKGKYFSVTAASGGASIVTALNQIFQEVQSVNSVFASTTLPVSVNVRGTNLNQVYIGVFRPDPNLSPRWFGNLKLYDLAVDSATGNLFLNDANGSPAANSSTGFISNSAKSFWTTTSSFWSFRSPYDTTDVGQQSDSPDGDLVEKGGVAQQLRIAYATDQSTRKIYTCTGTCTSGSALSASAFNTSNTNISAAALGTYTTYTVSALSSAGTTVTATATGHPFANGDSVVVAGATPTLYNGTYTISGVVASTSFQYTLSSAPSSNTGSAGSTNHDLHTGDLVTVTGSADAGYNVTDASVTKVDDNTFTYPLSAAVSAASTGHTVKGKKLVSTIIAPSGVGATATVTLPSHGFATNASITISGANESPFNGTYTITSTGTDTFTFPTASSVTGSGTTARVTSASHGFSTGDTITIAGASPSAYNGSFPITVIDGNTFTYTLPSGQTTDATGTITAVKGGTSFSVSSITHPTSGSSSSQNTFTVSTGTTNHGYSVSQAVTIAGANEVQYNGTFTITSSNTSTSPYTMQFQPTSLPAVSTATTPATGTITATKSGGSALTVASITHPTSGSSSNQSTATVTTVATHGYSNGDKITIAGASQSAYNGTWVIANVNAAAKTFTFTNEGVQSWPTPATGTITVGTGSTKTVSALGRVVTATGTIYASRTISPITINVQTSASGTITAGRTSDTDTTARTNLINWVRGQDNNGDENANGSSSDARSTIHGDVLHSRPAVINYNRNGDDNDVYAFYGANDGIFHAVKGGFATGGGAEEWGFIPSEFFGKLKRLRDNSPVINSVNLRDYFFDGPIGVYTKDVNSDGKLVAADGDKVYLYIGMRRGGRYIYALDVSDPSAPKFMWKKGCPNLDNNTGCSSGYSELGQTWSEPKVAFLKAYTNPVLIFGAGYDPGVEDFQPCLITRMPPDATSPTGSPTYVTSQTGGTVSYTSAGSCNYTGTTATKVDRSKGRGIFIVDATDGSVLFRFGPDGSADKTVSGMEYSIAADVVVLNRDRDNTRSLPGKENIQPLLSGYADRVYAVDTGGNIWRLDLDSATTSNWVVTQFASISGTALTDKRKFLFPPDVVYTSDSNGNYDAVLIGSGDREHPFDATVNNRYYMFKDRKTGLNATGQATIVDTTYDASTAPNGLFDATSNCLQDSTVCTASQQTTARANLLAARGWKMNLGTGEKSVGTSTTVAGTTLFNTNQPSASAGGGSCGSNLGIARSYMVSFKDATATTELNGVSGVSTADRSVVAAGGGYLPSPVPVIVQIDGKKYQAVISGTQVASPGSLKLESRIRTYWSRKIE